MFRSLRERITAAQRDKDADLMLVAFEAARETVLWGNLERDEQSSLACVIELDIQICGNQIEGLAQLMQTLLEPFNITVENKSADLYIFMPMKKLARLLDSEYKIEKFFKIYEKKVLAEMSDLLQLLSKVKPVSDAQCSITRKEANDIFREDSAITEILWKLNINCSVKGKLSNQQYIINATLNQLSNAMLGQLRNLIEEKYNFSFLSLENSNDELNNPESDSSFSPRF